MHDVAGELKAALLADHCLEAFDTQVAWQEILRDKPEWREFVVVGEEHGSSKVLFLIPSAHPTVRKPLTITLEDDEVVSRFRVSWGDYYEDVFRLLGTPTYEDALREAIAKVEEWTSDAWALILRLNDAPDSPWRSRARVPIDDVTRRLLSEAVGAGETVVMRSWLGTHDLTISPSDS